MKNKFATGGKNYVRKGGQVATGPKGGYKSNKEKLISGASYDSDVGGSLAARAASRQRSDDLVQDRAGMTREEFDAIRRNEEEASRESIRQLRLEHHRHEAEVRNHETHLRHAAAETEPNIG